MEGQIKELKKEISDLKKEMNKKFQTLEKNNTKKSKIKKAPSPYNLFVKSELEKLKKQYPEMEHKNRFKMAVSEWKKQHP